MFNNMVKFKLELCASYYVHILKPPTQSRFGTFPHLESLLLHSLLICSNQYSNSYIIINLAVLEFPVGMKIRMCLFTHGSFHSVLLR